jgi:hypothetical protein
MTITVDINGLKELDKVRNEEIFGYLMFGDIELPHQVDEGWEFETPGVELELFFEQLHVLLG